MGNLIADKVTAQYSAVWAMFGSPVREAIIDAAVCLQMHQQDSSVTDGMTGTQLLDRATEWRAAAIARLESAGMSV
jgi:hypothetical protein